MKRIIITAVLAIVTVAMSAQFQAIGLRLTHGAEVSAQIGIDPFRLQADLGVDMDVRQNNLDLTLTAQLVNDLSKGFKFYYGLGATADFNFGVGVSIGPAAIGGFEYNFRFPLQLFMDYRPAIILISNYRFGSFEAFNFGLGARYTF